MCQMHLCSRAWPGRIPYQHLLLTKENLTQVHDRMHYRNGDETCYFSLPSQGIKTKAKFFMCKLHSRSSPSISINTITDFVMIQTGSLVFCTIVSLQWYPLNRNMSLDPSKEQEPAPAEPLACLLKQPPKIPLPIQDSSSVIQCMQKYYCSKS